MRSRTLMLALGLAIVAVWLVGALVSGADPSAVPSVAPSPTPRLILESGDLRSEGAGPGLVGNPLLILAAVVAVGIGTALLTLVVARLAQRR